MHSLPHNYKADLHPDNEVHTACVVHPDRVAHIADVDDDGRKVPVCTECWDARYPAIRLRLRAQGFFAGEEARR